jgi:hypothetical protein
MAKKYRIRKKKKGIQKIKEKIFSFYYMYRRSNNKKQKETYYIYNSFLILLDVSYRLLECYMIYCTIFVTFFK